jgi:hypothetical protein
MVQEIEKYIKLHVLGDFGDIWFGISEDIQKIEHLLQYIDDILKHRGGGTKRNHRKSMHKRKSNKKSRKHR